MSKNTNDGEIHDDVVYTHKRLAIILGRSEDWVVENIILTDPEKSEPIAVKKLGTLYFVTGQNFRLWMERNSQCTAKPLVSQTSE